MFRGKIKGANVSCPAYTHQHTHTSRAWQSICRFVKAKEERIQHPNTLAEALTWKCEYTHIHMHTNMPNPICDEDKDKDKDKDYASQQEKG